MWRCWEGREGLEDLSDSSASPATVYTFTPWRCRVFLISEYSWNVETSACDRTFLVEPVLHICNLNNFQTHCCLSVNMSCQRFNLRIILLYEFSESRSEESIHYFWRKEHELMRSQQKEKQCFVIETFTFVSPPTFSLYSSYMFQSSR